MLDQLIRLSLRYRTIVVLGYLCFFVWGVQYVKRMNIDVFPDLSAPTVTLVSDIHDLSPTEIESNLVIPLEAAMSGSKGVRRVRSQINVGNSITWVEFEWGTDIYLARQIVAEKLQLLNMSKEHQPVMAPISSIMGEIYFLGLSSKTQSLTELKQVADWTVRRRLMTVPGVANVINTGGLNRELQVLLDPAKLQQFNLNPLDVYEVLRESSVNLAAGFLLEGGQEYLIQVLGRERTLVELQKLVIDDSKERAILLEEIAEVKFGHEIARGAGGVNGGDGVVLAIQKQPDVNTLKLTERINASLDEIERGLSDNYTLHRNLLRQADFIEVAVNNVVHALRDGAILVVLILGLFLMNSRATLITILAIPFSMLVALVILGLMGATVNTMTLGGLAIAVGSLVDDAIIDVENVLRHLQLNSRRKLEEKLRDQDLVFMASKEVRSAIFFATLIIILVFLPLFFLSGMEGRLLIPLGIAYIASLSASLIVALTLTPALCLILLPVKYEKEHGESSTFTFIKTLYLPGLMFALRYPRILILGVALMFGASVFGLHKSGQSFLPEFQEGSLTIGAVTLPGTSLQESTRLGRSAEKALLEFDEVVSTVRRTGRADQDEHGLGVNASEIEVKLNLEKSNKQEFLKKLRKRLKSISGVNVTIGQPISHRMDHMLSGTRAAVAVKVFGHELGALQSTANQILSEIQKVEGVVDAGIEAKTMAPALTIRLKKDRLALHRFQTKDVLENIEVIFQGIHFGDFLEEYKKTEMVVKIFPEAPRKIEAVTSLTLLSPKGQRVPLTELASIEWDSIASSISREGSSRKMVVMCNVAGRDLSSVVGDIEGRLSTDIDWAEGQYFEMGGQFESAREATEKITLYSALVLILIFSLLMVALGSARDSWLVYLNLPLALIGGVAGVWVYDQTISVASLVGFIALFGIATRNGLMLVTHYHTLASQDDLSLEEIVRKGSMERLAPILMTALASGLALVPLAMAQGEPGSEIQTPMAFVMLFGLLSSTVLNMYVLPGLYMQFGALGDKLKTRLKVE